MIVMPSNNCKAILHYLAGRHPDKLGHLYGPGGQRGPFEWFPYALENGVFPAWSNALEWNPTPFLELLEWAAGKEMRPLFVNVPDAVGDRVRTLELWDEWMPRVAPYGFPLAFVVQDGMRPEDVPAEASVVFVGGSTEWKRMTIPLWCQAFPGRVHVGRINTARWVYFCERAGAMGCDGTGWLIGGPDGPQFVGLRKWLEGEPPDAVTTQWLKGQFQRHRYWPSAPSTQMEFFA